MPKTPDYHPTKNVVYIRDIPGRLKDLFVAECVARDYAMQKVVFELMKLWLLDPGDWKIAPLEKSERVGMLYLRDIPAGVKNEFKAVCRRRNTFMKEVVVSLIREFLLDPTLVKPKPALLQDYLPKGVLFVNEITIDNQEPLSETQRTTPESQTCSDDLQ